MRFSVGKKIGGIYVGTSISGKKAVSGIAMLFLWPFYLIYYFIYFVFVWPVLTIIRLIRGKSSVKSERISDAEAKSIINSVHTTAKILSETKVPDTFFSRVKLIKNDINRIANYSSGVTFDGKILKILLLNLKKHYQRK